MLVMNENKETPPLPEKKEEEETTDLLLLGSDSSSPMNPFTISDEVLDSTTKKRGGRKIDRKRSN